AFALSGYPAGAVMQASAGNKLRFISFSDGMLDKALAKNRAYKSVEIPADVYGTAEPGTVIGVNNMLIAPNSLSADVVEKIVASVFDHLDEFQAENANAKQIDPAASLSLAIPLHAGAARYFEK
ncbi:MAG: TAXI family TRAP transporter solute-binding subunit, partial [Nisaea sp.]